MEIQAGPRHFGDGHEEEEVQWKVENGSLSFYGEAKELQEAIIGGSVLVKTVVLSEDQALCVHVGETGKLNVFDVESGEHLFYLDRADALDLLAKIRKRYLKGKLMYKHPSRDCLCFCDEKEIFWEDMEPYHRYGLNLKPGDLITKFVILKAYRILQECYAKASGMEPYSLTELCFKQEGLTTHPEFEKTSSWSVPYILMRHEGMIAMSIYEEDLGYRRLFISLA